MSASILLPVLLLVVSITAFGLAGYGFGRLGARGVRGWDRPVVLRSLAALFGAAAAAVYTWGLLCVALTVLDAEDGGAGSAPVRPCAEADAQAWGAAAVDYRVEYLPVRFVCETGDGRSHATDDVPGYVTPAAVGAGLTAAVLAVSAGWVSQARARAV
ncbi:MULTISPECIES: hypothetical protein [unclassified Streptomyces]|uniref:hypothetical protein n=1 Tax=unclassified Streptomyces TaxID=2593676 RepID=UPI001CBF4AC0|nr:MULTISPECIES: hypothetical protein [unclassified Streptomyces]WPO69758.1 hypothetical protein R9806_03465 [Streptomyces sp. KN37]